MHLIYGQAECNSRAAERLYRQKFRTRRHPAHTIFPRIDRRMRKSGTFKPNLRENGARRSMRTPSFEEEVLELVAEQPSTSTRALAHALGSNRYSVWQVLHEQQLYPYRLQKVQAISPADFGPRFDFCRWYLQQQAINNQFQTTILFSDECCFTRDGIFNSRNSHFWEEENPHAIIVKSSQYRFSLNIWAGIIMNHLLGPFVFPPRLNAAIYLEFLENTLPELLEDVPLAVRQRMWLQHDGAPPHFTNNICNYLNRQFSDRWIGRGGPVAWPALRRISRR